MKIIVIVAFGISFGLAANAACPSKAPGHSWALKTGDETISGAQLEKLVRGKNLRYSEGGVEIYGSDGSYTYGFKGKEYRARKVKYYKDGVRCLDYGSQNRFDRYVVNKKKLVFIDKNGNRSVPKFK